MEMNGETVLMVIQCFPLDINKAIQLFGAQITLQFSQAALIEITYPFITYPLANGVGVSKQLAVLA